MHRGGQAAQRGGHVDASARVVGEETKHGGPGVADRWDEGLEHRRGSSLAVAPGVGHRSGNGGRVGEADAGEERAHLQVRVLAGLQEPVQLEDQAVAEHDRCVRLLDPKAALAECVDRSLRREQQLGERIGP